MGAILFFLKNHIINYNDMTAFTKKLNEVYETQLYVIKSQE